MYVNFQNNSFQIVSKEKKNKGRQQNDNNTITRAARSTRLLLLQVLVGVGCIPPFLYSVESYFCRSNPWCPSHKRTTLPLCQDPPSLIIIMSKFPSSYKEISFHKQTPFPFCSSAEEGEYDSGRELQLHSNNLSSDNLPQNLNNPTFQVPQLPLSNWDSKMSMVHHLAKLG